MNSSGQLVPGDEGWAAEKALVADLSTLNTQIGRYVLRLLDADAGRAEQVSVDDERALAGRLAGLASTLRARVERRAALGELPATVEGGNPQLQALQPSLAMDNGP